MPVEANIVDGQRTCGIRLLNGGLGAAVVAHFSITVGERVFDSAHEGSRVAAADDIFRLLNGHSMELTLNTFSPGTVIRRDGDMPVIVLTLDQAADNDAVRKLLREIKLTVRYTSNTIGFPC